MRESATEAVEAAEKLREETWGSTIPVDPAQIAAVLGIRVLTAPLSKDFAGAIVKRAGEDPEIFLNVEDSPARKRFTCAHELGHYVQASDAPDYLEFFDYRSSFDSENMPDSEFYANAFAAALLMPKQALEEMQSDKMDAIEMALYFGVSREALKFRLDLDD